MPYICADHDVLEHSRSCLKEEGEEEFVGEIIEEEDEEILQLPLPPDGGGLWREDRGVFRRGIASHRPREGRWNALMNVSVRAIYITSPSYIHIVDSKEVHILLILCCE